MFLLHMFLSWIFIINLRLEPGRGMVPEGHPPVDIMCEHPDAFHCDDTTCITKTATCNGISECRNGQDESVKTCGCQSDEFKCDNYSCIDLIKRCDRNIDCVNGTDELDCETFRCAPSHFSCLNHYCIPRDLQCDFVDDCGDNSDEESCKYRLCFPTEWRCNNSQCIAASFLCDGEADCLDGSDEIDCERHAKCANGLYVSAEQRCDGWVDCVDSQTDELNCGPCQDWQYSCDNSRCISLANRCDGVCDCGSSCEDEDNCGSVPCLGDDVFVCPKEHRCIRRHHVCDGHNDCMGDRIGHDEAYCVNNGDPRPEDCALECGDKCVPHRVTCDYTIDCLDGEDEFECNAPCEKELGKYQCGNGRCIDEQQRCDQNFDCEDLSDERDCDNVPCPLGYRKCWSGQCVPRSSWCNFHRDCWDGSDEANCSIADTCSESEFRCENGQCIPETEVCLSGPRPDGTMIGCADGSHLLHCKDVDCSEGLFKCRNSYCINETLVCDDQINCLATHNDQNSCNYPCPYPEKFCTCIDEDMICEELGLEEMPNTKLEFGLSKFHLPGNRIPIYNNTFEYMSRLIYLDLSNNSITQLPENCFSPLLRLSTLNLANNSLTHIANGTFSGLVKLHALYLEGNRIEKLEAYSFVGLSALKVLDLSFQQLNRIPAKAFVGLRSLTKLNLSFNSIKFVQDGAFIGLQQLMTLDVGGNNIILVEDNVFHGLPSLKRLYTDEFRFCCLATTVEQCYPPPDEFSSCEDLMSNGVLRVCIWVLGLISLVGNSVVIVWRARDTRHNRVHSFLITNLAIGDLTMGVYMLTIAAVDTHYRGIYILYDLLWRKSALCQFAGFLSTLSSELSVFTLTVITIDRAVAIIFPFKFNRLSMREYIVIMIALWIVVLLVAGIPLFNIPYFENFYGRSGVCLALHITWEKPPGWEYSVFVFLSLNFISFLIIFIAYVWMFVVARETRAAVRSADVTTDKEMAKRMALIVLTDFVCWIPIIALGVACLSGLRIPPQVYAWIAVFILPLNSAVNPVLYTMSTTSFRRHVRRRVFKFRQSFITSLAMSSETKTSFDERTSHYEKVHIPLAKKSRLQHNNIAMGRLDSNNFVKARPRSDWVSGNIDETTVSAENLRADYLYDSD